MGCRDGTHVIHAGVANGEAHYWLGMKRGRIHAYESNVKYTNVRLARPVNLGRPENSHVVEVTLQENRRQGVTDHDWAVA